MQVGYRRLQVKEKSQSINSSLYYVETKWIFVCIPVSTREAQAGLSIIFHVNLIVYVGIIFHILLQVCIRYFFYHYKYYHSA